MSKAGVRVEGARELRRSLRRAAGNLDDLKAAHGLAGAVVAGAAKPRTPRRSGRLASSVRSSGTTTAAVIRAGYASVPYAGPIHWGWPARHIKPQPWLSETATATEPSWLPIYEHAVEAVLDTIRGANQ